MVSVLVSGGNRGIGYGIVRKLAVDFPTSQVYGSTSEPLTIYLGARDKSKGEEARKAILKEIGASTDRVSIEVRQLDVSSHDSIAALAQDFKSGLDILINNVGIYLDGFDGKLAKETIDINYYAVKDMINTIPVKDGGRIINVASMLGVLTDYGETITQRFLEAKTFKQVDELMDDFVKDVSNGTYKENGWNRPSYHTSKCGLIAYTNLLAEEHKKQGKRTLINSCCPGYVKTDLNNNSGYKTLDQGAETPVLLALQETKGISGEFWSDKKVVAWHKQ